MTKEQIRQLLEQYEIQPSRKLGQNFLIDQNFSRWMADQMEPTKEDTVIEIGPGLGSITEYLVDRVGRLILVEKDHRLAERLRNLFQDEEHVTVFDADAVQFDVRPYFALGPIKVIGNLPYSAGTEIIRNFMSAPSPVVRAVFTLQKEVIERIVAVERTKAYGPLSICTQARWRTKQIRVMGPDIFYPRPAVDSAVVLLIPREPEELPLFNEPLFDRLVRHGFSQRRKQLKKLLPKMEQPWEDVFETIDKLPTTRAEELTLTDWISLTNKVDTSPADAQRPDERFDVDNEQDEVIDQQSRSEVHASGARHRSVHLLVFNRSGEVFLQKRSRLKDTGAGLWDSSAAGHVDAGETYASAAVRELKEELNLTGDLTPVSKLPASAETGNEFVEVYAVNKWKGKLRWPCQEIDCGTFFPVEVIDRWLENRPADFACGFPRVWEAWKKQQISQSAGV